MHCRDAEKLIFAERDRTLVAGERRLLEAHTAECAACRRVRLLLGEAAETLRARTAAARSPDPERGWAAIRRRVRTGDDVPDAGRLPGGSPVLRWVGAPLVAAAAIALAVFVGRPWSGGGASARPPARMAYAESVELGDARATPVVFVDEETGWLVVWTVPANGASGS